MRMIIIYIPPAKEFFKLTFIHYCFLRVFSTFGDTVSLIPPANLILKRRRKLLIIHVCKISMEILLNAHSKEIHSMKKVMMINLLNTKRDK